MYKKALSAFFLKVHPDFFHFNPTYRTANENAVAQLNELLGWAKEYKKGFFTSPPATKIDFLFYQREEAGGDASNHATRSDPEGSGGDEDGDIATPLRSTFELPSAFKPQEANRGVVERSINKFLRDLLRRASCMDSVTSSISEAQDNTAQRLEDRPLRRRRVGPRGGGPRVLRARQQDEEEGEEASSLLDDASESFAAASPTSAHPVPSLEELMEADMVFLSTDLSPLQCATALHTLRQSLNTLAYHRWESMPLVISDRFAVSGQQDDVSSSGAAGMHHLSGEHLLSGGFSVPWDFTPSQFLAFISRHDAALRVAREAAFQRATQLESLIGELCHALRWDDILISCSHSIALRVLQLLRDNIGLLESRGVTDLTIELSRDHFATRANGVLILNCQHLLDGQSSSNSTPLDEWVKAVLPKLALQKELYRVSKQLMATTEWYVKETTRVLSPAQLDATEHNDCSYAQRLQWVKELFRVSAALSKWDWSEFSFLLGPGEAVDLDWEKGVMVLPYNVDGDALVRYVEDIHQQAKEKHRSSLVAAHESQRRQTEQDREEQQRQQLLLGEEGAELHDPQQNAAGADAGGDGSIPPYPAPTPSIIFPSAEDVFPSQENGAVQSDQHPTPSHPRHEAYMDEYMMSSALGSPDALSVERPLAHLTSHHSDASAEDNLKWEGFYQEPYVDQVPTGDLDDMQHTFHLTNRNYREAAAKKLLEELQGSYGAKSRRFDYRKMGDVLEINNAKVQPKGFPILSKGIRRGE